MPHIVRSSHWNAWRSDVHAGVFISHQTGPINASAPLSQSDPVSVFMRQQCRRSRVLFYIRRLPGFDLSAARGC